MTIVVPEVTITGLQEKLIRDNVANPDSDLGSRALTQLVAPYKQQTLQRAQQAYRAAHAADPSQTLPNFLDDTAVIEWYLATDGYKNATQREAEAAAIRAQAELQSLTAERSRHERKLAGATAEMRPAIQATIDALTDQIEALQATVSEA